MKTNIYIYIYIYILYHISLSSSQNKECFGQICRENKNTFFVYEFFFFENLDVCEIMWKIVQPDRPQMTIWRMRIACWVLRLRTHFQNMEYLLYLFLFYCHNDCTKAPVCYVICNVPVCFFTLVSFPMIVSQDYVIHFRFYITKAEFISHCHCCVM